MSTKVLAVDGSEKQEIKVFTEQAYLDYAMYVILDRALPNIGDGLKPVQRRIIYAMSELHLSSTAKHKKSARTIGDVLGKFHPHGDSACYEAMVLMAQNFAYRYPFIDGQGNWGSADDPKSFAAMRYTEARLAKFANVLLQELGQGTVEWINNFDGTLKEPKILPSRLPNILLNGTTGIAVGMATDIPPHNVTEVANACVHLLENPKASINDILKIMPAPDYPTGAEIVSSKEDLTKIYQTGNGTIRARASYIEDNHEIVVTELPHMTSGAKILEQIASQMQSKKLNLVADLRDESDHENPVRLVIVPRSNRINVAELMDHLFATTDLEKTYRVNLNVIGLNGLPKVKNILEILTEWLEYRKNTVTSRLQYRLEKILARLEIVAGLLIAFLNIDEVINIIRKYDDPKDKLMKKFKISEIQANAILDIKLRSLAKLEEQKILAEQQELNKERETIEKVLASKTKLKNLVKEELKQDIKEYGDQRRSRLVTRAEAKVIKISTKTAAEPVTVVLSAKGWIRYGKGHEVDLSKLNYKTSDEYLQHVTGTSDQPLVVLDSTGRSYSLDITNLPSMRGYGEPLTVHLSPPNDANSFTTMLLNTEETDYLLISKLGYGFIANTKDLYCKNKKGKAIINLGENVELFTVMPLPTDYQDDYLSIVSNDGKLLIFAMEEIPKLAKGKGKKLLNITSKKFADGKGSVVAGAKVVKHKAVFSIVAGKRKLEITAKDWKHYLGEAANPGFSLPKGYLKVKEIV